MSQRTAAKPKGLAPVQGALPEVVSFPGKSEGEPRNGVLYECILVAIGERPGEYEGKLEEMSLPRLLDEFGRFQREYEAAFGSYEKGTSVHTFCARMKRARLNPKRADRPTRRDEHQMRRACFIWRMRCMEKKGPSWTLRKEIHNRDFAPEGVLDLWRSRYKWTSDAEIIYHIARMVGAVEFLGKEFRFIAQQWRKVRKCGPNTKLSRKQRDWAIKILVAVSRWRKEADSVRHEDIERFVREAGPVSDEYLRGSQITFPFKPLQSSLPFGSQVEYRLDDTESKEASNQRTKESLPRLRKGSQISLF